MVNETPREKQIVKTSIIGIIANVLLAAFKAVIGLMTHSIAIVLDAVNNISDAGGSLITIVGTKQAGKGPENRLAPSIREINPRVLPGQREKGHAF